MVPGRMIPYVLQKYFAAGFPYVQTGDPWSIISTILQADPRQISPMADALTNVYTLANWSKTLREHTNFLLTLLGKDGLAHRMELYFPVPHSISRFALKFDASVVPTSGDYARFFAVLDRLYRLLLTITSADYFVTHWLLADDVVIANSDSLQVSRVVRNSPGEIEGTAVKETITVLKDVLSIGKQWRDIKLAPVEVDLAKQQLKRAELELQELKRQALIGKDLAGLDRELAIEQKLYEIETLRRKRLEEQLKAQQLQREDVQHRFQMLAQKYRVIELLPMPAQGDIIAAVHLELEELIDLPFEVKEVMVLADQQHEKANTGE